MFFSVCVFLLSLHVRLYGRVVIERMVLAQIRKEQCGIDQVFGLKNLCENYLQKQEFVCMHGKIT